MASMTEKDYYAILEISTDASDEEIRKAFQKKARKLHPDVNKAPDAEERFKEVSEAYAVLSDSQKRARYDAMRSGNPFAGYAGSAPSQGSYSDPFGAGPFGWGFPFGGSYQTRSQKRSRSYNPRVGQDVVMQVTLNDQKAKEGTKQGVTYQRYVACEVCHGSGSVETAHAQTCPTCHGSGSIGVDLSGLFGFGVMNMTCPECEGTGKVVADPCSACGGTGRTLSASEVVVTIPPHVHDGDEVRIEGMGNAGTNGSTAGDFVCRVAVPSEQLQPRQGLGFQLLGFDAPFVLFSLIAGMLSSVAVFVAVLAVVGLVLILTGGHLSRSARWWKNAGSYFMGGFSQGFILALLMVSLYSCTASMTPAAYRYGGIQA